MSSRRTLAIVGWQARGFRRMWRGSITVSFLNPIFFLVSIGVLLGNLVEAREVLLSVERLPPSPSESEKAKHARGDARALAEQIRARIPAVRLAFDPPQATAPHVTVDAVEIPPEALGVPRRMNPGKHVVVL